jgi:hypothetical protein
MNEVLDVVPLQGLVRVLHYFLLPSELVHRLVQGEFLDVAAYDPSLDRSINKIYSNG